MTKLTYVLHTLMIYATAFMFIYVAEVTYELYMKQYNKYRSIFGGAVLGLSLSMVIFIVEYMNLTGVPDGRFTIILISTSFFGVIGGLTTAVIVLIASFLNNYYEEVFLLVNVINHLLVGLFVYYKKKKSMKIHVLINVAGVLFSLSIALVLAKLFVKDATVELDNILSFALFVYPLIGLFTFSISIVFVREINRGESIKAFSRKQKELIQSNREISGLNNKLKNSENKYKLIMEASDEGFVEYNHFTKTMFLSERSLEIFDHLVEGPEVSLWEIFNILDDQDSIKIQREFQKLKTGKLDNFEIKVKTRQKDDENRHINFKGIVNHDKDGLITIVGTIKDIHDKVIKEEMIFDLAYKDEISGMYNENAFIKDLNKCLLDESKGNIFFINISGFSNYSSIGTSYRNIIRMHFSVILKRYFYLEDCYYIQEGAFAIHVGDKVTFEEATYKFDKLNEELVQPLRIKDTYIPIKINGVYVPYPYGTSGSEGLVARGISALASLERNNINELVLFNENIYNKQYRINKLESYIVNAIDNKELYMMYQPQYDHQGKAIIGYEALIRWESEIFGFVSPAEFIPIAEKNGTIYKIGQYVIKEVCDFMNQFIQNHGFIPKVSINVSLVELINPNFAHDLKELVLSNKIPTSNLIIEITETAIAEFLDIALNNIRIIRALGFEIHLDDFGTGYSSLNHLGKLSIDCVKIDKSFIDDVHLDTRTKGIVQSIIELSHRLSMTVIAEGIELEEQFKVLKELACDGYQGYYFNRPLKSEVVLEIDE